MSLATTPGAYKPPELEAWAAWFVGAADRLRRRQWATEDENQPHRWPFEVVQHLPAFPASLIADEHRATALALVGEAFQPFRGEPLAASFPQSVAEVEHALRRHLGERNTHRTLAHRITRALEQQATLFRAHGHSLGAVSMYRAARKVTYAHGQRLTSEDRARLARAEREQIAAAVARGELRRVGTIVIST